MIPFDECKVLASLVIKVGSFCHSLVQLIALNSDVLVIFVVSDGVFIGADEISIDKAVSEADIMERFEELKSF